MKRPNAWPPPVITGGKASPGVLLRPAPALNCTPPPDGEDLWELRFGLQAEADPSLKLPAAAAWASGAEMLQLGEIQVDQPGEVLLEGLGRP